ncbi:Retinal Homeobox [Carabus blaptoides fortunei]
MVYDGIAHKVDTVLEWNATDTSRNRICCGVAFDSARDAGGAAVARTTTTITTTTVHRMRRGARALPAPPPPGDHLHHLSVARAGTSIRKEPLPGRLQSGGTRNEGQPTGSPSTGTAVFISILRYLDGRFHTHTVPVLYQSPGVKKAGYYDNVENDVHWCASTFSVD